MSFALHKYRSARTTTVSPLQVLIQLYQGAIRFMRDGADAIEAGDTTKRGVAFGKAYAIVAELQATLDDATAPELCAQLHSLYDFVLRQITQANTKKDADAARAAVNVMEELLSGWSQLEAQRGAA
ncbi:MAG: flagellar export chaperone FliS [Myxococcota bacterium]